MQLDSFNHITIVVSDLLSSLAFYEWLGYKKTTRPQSLENEFDGVWLTSSFVNLHFIHQPSTKPKPSIIIPRSNHIAFNSISSPSEIEKELKERAIPFVQSEISIGDRIMIQFFIHDPDSHMIEIQSIKAISSENNKEDYLEFIPYV